MLSSFRLSDQTLVCSTYLSHACYMPRSHSISPMRATCPAYLTLLDLIILRLKIRSYEAPHYVVFSRLYLYCVSELTEYLL
jgi:hypothetical protein